MDLASAELDGRGLALEFGLRLTSSDSAVLRGRENGRALMKTWLAVPLAGVVLLGLSSFAGGAPALFESCEVALQTAAFSPLRGYFDSASPIQNADQCMRLTKGEFIVTGNEPGPYDGDPSNVFYCNLNRGEPVCAVDEPSTYYPSLSILRQFSGPKGKQYVLWKTSRLRHGIVGSGYGIFTLAPRSRSPRGYVIYQLSVGTYCSYSEGASGCGCNNLAPGTNKSERVEDPEVINEGLRSVRLAFKTSTTDCATSRVTNTSTTFVLVDGQFALENRGSGGE
jgi:hypothetical protein